MSCIAVLTLALLLPSTDLQDKEAMSLAQEILTKGAALYDTHDAMSMALTYTEDAKLYWIDKNKDTGKIRVEVKDGRGEIEKVYRDMFKDPNEKTTARNTVEFAKLVSPELLVIEGQFEPNIDKGKYNFTQERVKVGGKWLIQSLRLYIVD